MSDYSLRWQALDRQRRRLAELEQRLTLDRSQAAPDLLSERDELNLIISLLEAGLPSPAPADSASAAPSSLAQRLTLAQDAKEMVLVPAGACTIGADHDSRQDERPAHVVQLPAFYIDRTPVTVAEYARFVSATGRPAPRRLIGHKRPHNYEQHPVTGVSWLDAHAYATWAGKRLPSEAEWEKAAAWDPATGQKRRYPWGDTWDARFCNSAEADIGHTTPVGTFSPYGDAPCGAVDMSGNVSEWTASLAWNYPGQPGDGRDEPTRYAVRVRRGGSFASERYYMRSTARMLLHADGLFLSDGFRCVADPPGE
jgi:formylglycine-generating enzyme required for sulfatase activity